MSDLMQSLWIGRTLSVMERLSIASFLAHGHEYHLYTYEPVENAPAGTVFRPAAEILEASRIFQYKQFPSYAGFANLFRYKLLSSRGGWWVDTDVVCLGPFDFDAPYVFASEPSREGSVPSNAVLKVPAGSTVMARNWEVCAAHPDPAGVAWGELGPKLMARSIEELGLQRYLQAAEVFCPVPWDKSEAFLDPAGAWIFGESTRAVHLWNEMWRRAGRSRDGDYPESCLYQQLKARFLEPSEALRTP